MGETLDLALEEKLDTLDPLRHLRNDEELDDADIVPLQPLSIHNQTLDLSYPSAHSAAPNSISIRLAIDATPGCGGITWPAGEVGHDVLSQFVSSVYEKVLRLNPGPFNIHSP